MSLKWSCARFCAWHTLTSLVRAPVSIAGRNPTQRQGLNSEVFRDWTVFCWPGTSRLLAIAAFPAMLKSGRAAVCFTLGLLAKLPAHVKRVRADSSQGVKGGREISQGKIRKEWREGERDAQELRGSDASYGRACLFERWDQLTAHTRVFLPAISEGALVPSIVDLIGECIPGQLRQCATNATSI